MAATGELLKRLGLGSVAGQDSVCIWYYRWPLAARNATDVSEAFATFKQRRFLDRRRCY